MNKIAIFGGLGYIGSHIIELTLKKTKIPEIIILDNLSFGKEHMMDLINNPRVTLIEGDITNAMDIAKSVKDCDCVVMMAGLVGDPACSINEEDTWLVNTESSRIIADVCNHYKVENFVFSSSCSVYGASPSHIILNEGSFLNPVSWYAKSKIDSEKIFFENIEGNATNLRLATVFGFSRRMRFDLVANLFTIKALKDGKLDVFGGEQYRPFIHCFDAARAFLDASQSYGNVNRENFNIISENISIRGLGELIGGKVKGAKVNLVQQKEDNRNYKVSGDKASWNMNFQPHFNISAGVEHMIVKLKENNFNDWQDNPIYYNHLCGKGK